MMGLSLLGRKGRTPEDLKRMMLRGDVNGLLKLTTDSETEVSMRSLKLVGDMLERGAVKEAFGPKTMGAVSTLLNSPITGIRAYAVRAMYWYMMSFGAEDIYSSGATSKMVALLQDGDAYMRRYALYCLYEMVGRGHADAVVYADGPRALGSLLFSSDPEEGQLVVNLVSELAEKGFGAEMIRSGIARALLRLAGRKDEEGRRAENVLLRVFSPLGMVDLSDIERHLDETEHDAGVQDQDVGSTSTDMDAYFFGGATAASRKSSQIPTGGSGADTDDGEEFELDLSVPEVIDSSDDDLEELIYSTEGRTVRTETLLNRLRDLRKFMDQHLISKEEYVIMKSELLKGLSTSVSLETLDCYSALQVPRDATPEMVKESYRRLANQYHPDRVEGMGPKIRELAMEEMTRLNHAREILLDPEKRRAHDIMLSSRDSEGVLTFRENN